MVQWKRREELVGREMIDGEAKRVGTAKDLAWSTDGSLAIIVELNNEEEAFLPFEDIDRIGDVIFVKPKSTFQTAPTVTCPVCKHRNLLEAKFCAKCGKSLESKEEKKERKT